MVDNPRQSHTAIGDVFQSLKSDQCQQLMTFLSNRLSFHLNVTGVSDMDPDPCYTGTCLFVRVHSLFSNPQTWILDSGASWHVRSNKNAFIFMRPLQHYHGDVKIDSTLTLKDVLCVPEFEFNLISDLRNQRMVGRGNKVDGLYVLH